MGDLERVAEEGQYVCINTKGSVISMIISSFLVLLRSIIPEA